MLGKPPFQKIGVKPAFFSRAQRRGIRSKLVGSFDPGLREHVLVVVDDGSGHAAGDAEALAALRDPVRTSGWAAGWPRHGVADVGEHALVGQRRRIGFGLTDIRSGSLCAAIFG